MNPEVTGILMGAICGLVIGVERQWSGHASGPTPHFAGVRTQTLLGALGALSGWFWTHDVEYIAAILFAACGAIVAIAYAAVSRRDTDATTEVASLEVVTAGWLAGSGNWQLASGMTVVTAVLLMEKSRLHAWVAKISDTGLRASFRFALMAVVILPLLPEGPYGPLQLRLQALWIIVLLFSGISFAAYVVRSLLGPTQGYLWAGMLGGLISSTNVTLSFARLSRSDPKSSRSLAMGSIAACTMLNLRVIAAVTALNPAWVQNVAWLVLPPAMVGGAFLWLMMGKTAQAAASSPGGSPLQFRSALQMALLFQAVLLITSAVHDHWGSTGVVISGAILGFTDVDALVASMAKLGTTSEMMGAATTALGVGIVANTVLKLGLALTFGDPRFRVWAVAGLLLLGSTTGILSWILAARN